MEGLKFLISMFVFFYFAIGLTLFVAGFIQSGDPYHDTLCNKKITYLEHYTGFGYIAKLGCKAGKPKDDR